MSDDHIEMTETTRLQFVLALLGGLFAPLIAIALIVIYVINIETHHANEVPAGQATIAASGPAHGGQPGE
ncbi:MAG TPA: hypothetical protein VFN66_04355 [Burkholderiales bacterium]|nr:hypothetical protein [Burkholderiales bacterium]